LETANLYYKEAIRAGSVSDMIRAMAMRGEALYLLQRYDQAEPVHRRVEGLTLRNGELRPYLSARNILAMCLYRNEKYEESVAEFDALIHYWRKLKDDRETTAVIMNKANALAISGDYRGALDYQKQELPQISEQLQDLKAQLLGNMGHYAMELGLYEEAEGYLLQSLAIVRTLGLSQTEIRCRYNLIKCYEKTDRFTQLVEQYQLLLELLWEHRAYNDLTKTLKKLIELLLINKYGTMARDLQAQWEERFSKMEGGKEFFNAQLNARVFDSQRLDRLKEQLALAQSEGDHSQIAKLCHEMAGVANSEDPEQALSCLLKAAYHYGLCGQEDQKRKCLGQALGMVYKEGIPKDQWQHTKVLERLDDTGLRRIAALWEQIGKAEDQQAPSVQSVPQLLQELMTYGKTHTDAVQQCLTDLVHKIITLCSAQQIIKLISGLPEAAGESFSDVLEDKMLENFQRDIEDLTRDYHSPAALRKLAYYDKCMMVLEERKSPNVAAIAGNLAIIYRRRKEEEPTIRCHRISTEAYKRAGKTYDYLIELMNTATAYNELGKKAEAVELLRQGIKEAAQAGEAKLEAAMAGNLASFLCRSGNPEVHEEVMQCFAIEEGYFRNRGAKRDLVISLLNQIIYLQQHPKDATWLEKLREAGELIRSNRFHEYEKVLAQLEWRAKAARPAGETGSSDSAKDRVQQLLAREELYQIDDFGMDDGVYRVLCSPKSPSRTEKEQLCLFLHPDASNQLDVMCLCQPRVLGKNIEETIRRYVAWWNSLPEYHLEFREDETILLATWRIQAADWSGVIDQFSRFRRLWDGDKHCFVGMCMGLDDLAMFQGAKLRILNDDK
jgi:tetratricopeptide (TPR) repeat protein